jgi:hypothetical protein
MMSQQNRLNRISQSSKEGDLPSQSCGNAFQIQV